MSKRLIWLIVFIALLAFVSTACSGGTTSTSIGGAQLELGTDYDDDLYIVSPKTTFEPGENFYISFDNNAAFDSNEIAFQLVIVETDELFGEIIYDDVDPEWTIIVTEPLYVDEPGKYKVKAVINGNVRATQDIIIN